VALFASFDVQVSHFQVLHFHVLYFPWSVLFTSCIFSDQNGTLLRSKNRLISDNIQQKFSWIRHVLALKFAWKVYRFCYIFYSLNSLCYRPTSQLLLRLNAITAVYRGFLAITLIRVRIQCAITVHRSTFCRYLVYSYYFPNCIGTSTFRKALLFTSSAPSDFYTIYVGIHRWETLMFDHRSVRHSFIHSFISIKYAVDRQQRSK